jgi:hypothetical protein
LASFSQAQANPNQCASATILGTDGDDVIYGTDGVDIICSLDGDDTVYGLGGDDIILSGDGDDIVDAGPGNDVIWGELGSDELSGGLGSDTVYGGFGNDLIQLGDGDDEAYGDSGNDIIEGLEGEDYLSGGEGADQLYGGNGVDSLLGDGGNDGLNGGLGGDMLSGGTGSNTCVKDSADRVSKCFFDKSAPVLVNVAFSENQASVDARRDSVRVEFRATVQDVGSGIGSVSFCFSYDPESCDLPFYQLRVLETNGFRTIYEGNLTVPRNSKLGTIRLVGFTAWDRAFNKTSWWYSTLRAKKLAIGIKSVGAPDRTAPKLTSIRYPEGRIFDSIDTVRPVEIGFSNPQGEPFSFRMEYRLNNSGAMSVVTGAYVKAPNHPYLENYSQPSEYLTAEGCEVSLERACIYEGDVYKGKAIMYMKLDPGNWDEARTKYYPGTLTLDSYPMVTDIFGNTNSFKLKSSSMNLLAISKKFSIPRPVTYRDGDKTKPTLVSLKVNTQRINTASSQQVVTGQIKVKDSGIGWPTGGGGYVSLNLLMPMLSEDTEPQELNCETTKITSGLNAMFDFQCVFPAHIRDGIYKLDLYLGDGSTNRNNIQYSPSLLKNKKLPYWIKNG